MTKMLSTRSAHSKDLRKQRLSLANQIYLVTSVTEKRKPWFTDLYLGRILVHGMRQQQVMGCVDSLAFVVMPDHFHWLLQLQPGHALSEVMRSVKGRAARLIREMMLQNGSVVGGVKFWQDGFHDHALRKEEDLKDVARYVIANPLRAGLVSRIGDYPLWDAKWVE